MPRGKPCYELLGQSARFDMNIPVIDSPARGLSYKFMAAEAIWITDGSNSVHEIARYNSVMASFSDNGSTLFGAYGPKFVEQVDYVVDKLIEDRDTRQGVLTLWRERPPNSRDIPCTVSLQWMLRGSEIHCFSNMRSSDLWLGLPYDIFTFTAMTMFVRHRYELRAKNEKILLGNLYWSAASAHLYDHDMPKVDEVIKENPHGILIDHHPKNDWLLFRDSLHVIRDTPRAKGDWLRGEDLS